jgi:CBS domain containing-hemolysin-like protein
MKLIYILLVLAVLKCIAIYKTYHSIPVLELKRRARTKDYRAAALYKVAAYEASLDVLLWALGTASAAALLIWSARTNWWLATIVVVVTAWLVVWGRFSADGWTGRLAAIAAPFYAWFLSFAQPVLGRLAVWLPVGCVHIHSGLYEKKDLLKLLSNQNQQIDNRIPESDLHIAFSALQFGDKTVSSAMTPRRKVKLVSDEDPIGPILVDELHKTGFSRFPVVKGSPKSASPEVVATLYLSDLIDYDGQGKIKDLAVRKVFFINEDANLRQALSAFLKTHHHLLIVVNSFEEMVGVLSLEDVLEQVIGSQIVDEFDNYANLRAVAAHDAKQEQAKHDEVKPEQTDESVVN